MGEIAEMMLDGTLCQVCGGFIGEPCGYPRTCEDCESEDDGLDDVLKEITRLLKQLTKSETDIKNLNKIQKCLYANLQRVKDKIKNVKKV